MKDAWFNHGEQLCYGTVFKMEVVAEFKNTEQAKLVAQMANEQNIPFLRNK